MGYNTILVAHTPGVVTVTFNDVSRHNSITAELIEELNMVMDSAEADPECKVLIIQGQKGIFCTGMDFNEALNRKETECPVGESSRARNYMNILRRFSLIPRVVIAKVDGQVTAGGVGIVAASDLVIATPNAQFNLSEALWGLMPSMVLPYLIRRVGFQTAYRMALTTLPLLAQEAQRVHLVDEINESPEKVINSFLKRLMLLDQSTIGNIKGYFRNLWIINEQMEESAAAATAGLMEQPEIKRNIENFIKYKMFPWERNK
jgi:polyketide biosynthesis enoyl-CoA hydratase PksH